MINEVLFGSMPKFLLRNEVPTGLGKFYFAFCHLCLTAFLLFVFYILVSIIHNHGIEVFEWLHDELLYFFVHSNLIASLMLLLFAGASGHSAYNFRENATNFYGWAEIIVGMQTWAIGFLSFSYTEKGKVAFVGMPILLSVIGSIYIIVRGCDNVRRAAQKQVEREAKRKGDAEAAYLQKLVQSASSAASAAAAAAQATRKAAEIAHHASRGLRRNGAENVCKAC